MLAAEMLLHVSYDKVTYCHHYIMSVISGIRSYQAQTNVTDFGLESFRKMWSLSSALNQGYVWKDILPIRGKHFGLSWQLSSQLSKREGWEYSVDIVYRIIVAAQPSLPRFLRLSCNAKAEPCGSQHAIAFPVKRGSEPTKLFWTNVQVCVRQG